MEGNDEGCFPYYLQHHHLHLAPPRSTDPGHAAATGLVFPSVAGDGAGTPALFLHSGAPGGRAPALAPEPSRRKRGRPRKYGPPPSSAPSPPPSSSAAAAAFLPRTTSGGDNWSSSSPLPLGSSPPPGASPPSRKKAKQEALDAGRGAQNFTPHLFTVAAGEDVAQQIMAFVQQQKRAVCIISASGTICTATLHQPATTGGQLTSEGQFDIVSLSGSFLPADTGVNSRTGSLSVCLSNKHSVFGGAVGGRLIAAGPVQILAGSFSVSFEKNLAAPLNMAEENVRKLSTPSTEPVFSLPVAVWSTDDSAGRVTTNSATDAHHEMTGRSGNGLEIT